MQTILGGALPRSLPTTHSPHQDYAHPPPSPSSPALVSPQSPMPRQTLGRTRVSAPRRVSRGRGGGCGWLVRTRADQACKGVLRNLRKNEPEPGEAFRTEGSHRSSQPGGKSAPLVSRGLPLPPQPPSPTFPDTGPGHLPEAIPHGARPPGAKLAEPSHGDVPSFLLFLPAAPRARGRRLRHACLQALQPSQAARPGRPSPTRPPGARCGSLPASSSPKDRGPGSAPPPPPPASSSRPGRRRRPAPRRSRTRGAAGGAGGERRAERRGAD